MPGTATGRDSRSVTRPHPYGLGFHYTIQYISIVTRLRLLPLMVSVHSRYNIELPFLIALYISYYIVVVRGNGSSITGTDGASGSIIITTTSTAKRPAV